MSSDDLDDDLTPRQSRQLRALTRYLAAMERGDASALASVLREASDDPSLERLILELHTVYFVVDATAPTGNEVAQAQALLGARFTEPGGGVANVANVANVADAAYASPSPEAAAQVGEAFGATSPSALNGASHEAALHSDTSTSPSQPFWRRIAGRWPRANANAIGETTIMDTRNIPDETRGQRLSGLGSTLATDEDPSTTRRVDAAPIPATSRPARRWLRVAQGLVAAVVVAALVSSFFVILQRLHQPVGGERIVTITYKGVFNGKHITLVGDWVGEVYALDPTTGQPYWRFDMGDGHPVTGLLIEGDYVVVADTYLNNVRVFVLNLHTGQRVWTQARGTDGFPDLVYADHYAVYLCDASGTYGLRLDDGKQLWHIPDSVAEATANGVVYLATSLSNPPYGIEAIRSSDGAHLWSHSMGNADFPSVVHVTDQAIYVDGAMVGVDNTLVALSAQSGDTIATLTLPNGSQIAQITGTQLFDLIATPSSERFCAYQFPSIVELWCVPETYYPQPNTSTVQNGMMYVETHSSASANTGGVSAPPPAERPGVVAFDNATGHVRWHWVGPSLPAPKGNSPTGVSLGGAYDLQIIVGAKGTVYSGTSGGVFAIDGATGKLLWRFEPTAGDTFLVLTAM